MILSFSQGQNIDELSEKYKCSKLTVSRNLKKVLGELKYLEIIKVNKNLIQNFHKKNSEFNNDSGAELKINNQKNDFSKEFSSKEEINKDEFSSSPFLEIIPLDFEIDNTKRKDCSSIPISEIVFPNTVYMIVDKLIELEIKLLKDYPEWEFLPDHDLNRKTIEIFHDIKVAKRFCKKDQKVIKVPNTDVFKIVAPLLVSRGISRIVSTDKLIAL